MHDVARAVGVHLCTVSRTFSAPQLVNTQTRQRIQEMANTLGYVPNRAVRGPVTGRTHNLGLIVADIANPFFPPLVKAAEQQARGRGYQLFVADTDEDSVAEAELIHAMARQVDGILSCSPRMTNAQLEKLGQDVPIVTINRRVSGLPAVLMDVHGGTRSAIEHLTGLGHRDIGLLAGPRCSWTGAQIRGAATSAAVRAGARLTVFGPDTPNTSSGARHARAVVESGVTAVLAYNDLMGIGLIEALRLLGMSIPADISIVGIDDIPGGRLLQPTLTTVANPVAAAGRAAVDLLLQEPDRSFGSAELTLATRLVIRDSTGRVRAGSRKLSTH